jgi:predicted secreted protein
MLSMIKPNMKTILLASLVVISSITACQNSNNDEYELSPELKAKALAEKQALIDAKNGVNTKPKLTQESSPLWVPEQIFLAATTGDAAILGRLCDPEGIPEGKAKRLCDVPNTSQNEQEKFMEYFKRGKVSGEPIITDDRATVTIKVGYDGTAPETLNLIKRNGKWYLSSF